MGMIDVVINEDLQGGGDTHIPKKKIYKILIIIEYLSR